MNRSGFVTSPQAQSVFRFGFWNRGFNAQIHADAHTVVMSLESPASGVISDLIESYEATSTDVHMRQ
jgi:hypothetical protein